MAMCSKKPWTSDTKPAFLTGGAFRTIPSRATLSATSKLRSADANPMLTP